MEQIERSLLEGERILWAGKSAPFKIMEKPYNMILLITWGVCALLLLLITVGYLPASLSGAYGFSSGDALLRCAIMASVPVFIAARPFLDKRILAKKTFYAITDYRVMVVSNYVLRTMSYDENIPVKVDMVTDDTGTITIGAAGKSAKWCGRRQTLVGVRDEKDSPMYPYIGLTFYNVKDPEAVCRHFRKRGTAEEEMGMELAKAV